MASVADVMRELLDDPATLCVDCEHHAEKHVGLMGPCSECWELMQKICPRFHPSDEVRERLGKAAVEAVERKEAS